MDLSGFIQLLHSLAFAYPFAKIVLRVHGVTHEKVPDSPVVGGMHK